jgi:N-acetyl sugar amidotransferase
MDTSDLDISFDESGLCNHCREAEHLFRVLPRADEGDRRVLPMIERVKGLGRGRDYDAIVGLSGGVDSSYTAALASQYGLRVLAVHFDNGWNSELAVENIQRVVEGCGYDLMTYVIDWPEFRDIQRAFLIASVIDIEMITDHAIIASLYKLADNHGVKVILSGNNRATEHGMPSRWVWNKLDWTNIEAIHNRFGSVPLRTFPHLTRRRWLAQRALGHGPRLVEPLDLVPYRRADAATLLSDQFGWREYGGKHHESTFTKFYQAWILPTKFQVDKRRVHLSARIRNNELTRHEALASLAEPPYTSALLGTDRPFVLKKLGFSEPEFDSIMAAPPRRHDSFPSDRAFLDALRVIYSPVRAIRRAMASP